MLLDVFYVQYALDTQKADQGISDFGKRAEKAAKGIESSIDNAVGGINDGVRQGKLAVDDAAGNTEKLTNKLEGVKRVAAGIETAFGKIKSVRKVVGEIGQIGTLIRAGGVWGGMAAVEGIFSRAEEKAKQAAAGSAASGGAGGGLGGAGGAAAGAGGAGGMGMIRSLAAAGGPIGMAIAAAITTVSASVALSIRAGHQHAAKAIEFYSNLKQDAWQAGMSEKTLLSHQIAGNSLGISRESMQQGLAGLNERIKQVALHRAGPLGGIDLKTGQDTDPLSRLLRKRGISIQKGKHLESMSKIWSVIVDDLREAAEKKGTNYALARATQQYGLNFDQASKIIEATSAQIRAMNRDLEAQALMEWSVAQATKKLQSAQSQLKTETDLTEKSIDAKVVPAMKEWTEANTKWEKATRPIATLIGKMEAALISFGATVLDFVSNMIDGASDLAKDASDLMDEGKIRQNVAALTTQENQLAKEIKNALALNPNAPVSGKQAQLDEIRAKKAAEEAKLASSGMAGPDGKAVPEWATASLRDKAGDFRGRDGLTDEVIQEGIRKGVELGWSPDTLSQYYEEIIANQNKGMEANDAQFQVEKEKLTQIVQNTSVGLEQALALWAGGIGRAGGMGIRGDDMAGQSRADFEQRSRSIRFMGDRQIMQMAGQNAARAQEMAGAAKVKMSESSSKIVPNINASGMHVEVKADDPKTFGEQLGREVNGALGSMYKQIANTRDSVFKA